MGRRAGLDATVVVDAAAAIADTGGLEAVTLARVAKATGVRTPSLYAHVAGLDDLLARLAERGRAGLAEALRDAAVGRSGTEALTAVARAYRAYALEHPGLHAAGARAPRPGEPSAGAEAAVGVVVAVLAGYGLAGDDALHATRAVRAALHGFCALEAGGGFGMALAVDESFDRLVVLLDRGLGSASG